MEAAVDLTARLRRARWVATTHRLAAACGRQIDDGSVTLHPNFMLFMTSCETRAFSDDAAS
jgi:hypothetical protein